jgi:low density lipoprotein-related protein 2
MDEGGYGVPAKVGKVNMNGSNPIILLEEIERPEAITIDIYNKLLYFSAQYPSFVSFLLCSIVYKCSHEHARILNVL